MDIDLSTIEVMNAEAADRERAADGRADCGGQARLLGWVDLSSVCSGFVFS